MRSSRRTTGQVAENSVVDDATDACSLRGIIANYSFKVSLSESGITKTAPDQLGWIGMNGIYFWGGLNYEGTFMERGGVLN